MQYLVKTVEPTGSGSTILTWFSAYIINKDFDYFLIFRPIPVGRGC